jgi:DNA replication protein DnaC
MTAFLKIDDCKACRRSLPWEWVPAIALGGKALAGTGVWRSQLSGGVCPPCLAALERKLQDEQRARAMQRDLVQLLGGEKPYREFTFQRFEIAPGNQLAYERSKNFNPATNNLYLWGPCGVGKTHLAYAIARTCFEQTLSVTILLPSQLSRKVRMKDPEREQLAIDEFVRAEALVLDDMGMGNETPFSRQVFQEILDGRNFTDRAGLVVTSKYSLSTLAEKLNDDTIASRLAGMCQVVQIQGADHRLSAPRTRDGGDLPPVR